MDRVKVHVWRPGGRTRFGADVQHARFGSWLTISLRWFMVRVMWGPINGWRFWRD